MNEAPAVGIDLGTTYSCIAYYQNNEAKIIKNEEDCRITASYVSFTGNGRVIGGGAKNRAIHDMDNTLFGIKNFIGRFYDDPEVSTCQKIYPYKIVSNKGKPNLPITYQNESYLFAPEEISAMILQKLKEDATKYFGREVKKAVITVPAHFNDAQRQATKNAGRIAGLEVLKIINEPTAAALAYGIHNKYRNVNKEPTILVYDFGGGTFDVSIISVREGIFEVKATNGLGHLGGDDIDVNLMNFFADTFDRRHSSSIREDKKAMRRLRQQAEKVKETLSIAEAAEVAVDFLHRGEDFEHTITREEFATLNMPIFQKTMDCVMDTLKDANLSPNQIDEILLVGGSTRIPGVRQLLQDLFGQELNASLNPDEAVAMGAAIEAAILDNDTSNQIQEMLLLDVCPISLGIKIAGGRMSKIIPRNTTIPVMKTKSYHTTQDKQTTANILVYEGEDPLVANNVKLGEFVISGLPTAPKGEVTFDVNFNVNSDGILEVTATGFKNQTRKDLQVDTYKGHLTEEEILKMIQNEKEQKIKDENQKRVAKARMELEAYCFQIQKRISELWLSDSEKKRILGTCETTLKWLKGKKNTAEDLIKSKNDLEFLYGSYFK